MRPVILEVKDLSIEYKTDDGIVKAVNGVSFNLSQGETIGLVGETGAGKTTIALGIMGLLPDPPAKVTSGSILLENEDILLKTSKQMRAIRGKKVSMIFQDPMTALNPTDTVGEQICEVILLHEKVSKKEAKAIAEQKLETVGIPKERYNDYPHQFSGGMKQRVVIAIALACNPDLLIADEPTTALDVTIQAQILYLINKLKKEKGTSNILITHNLGVVAEMCERVIMIYAGKIIETGTVDQVFNNVAHPYTKGLLGALPDIEGSKQNRLVPIPGLMPDPTCLPNGCSFAERCPYKMHECEEGEIKLSDIGNGHFVRCLKPLSNEVSIQFASPKNREES